MILMADTDRRYGGATLAEQLDDCPEKLKALGRVEFGSTPSAIAAAGRGL